MSASAPSSGKVEPPLLAHSAQDLVSLQQIAGRGNPSDEYDNAEVWDFRHDAGNGLSLHPRAKLSRRILEQVFAECGEYRDYAL